MFELTPVISSQIEAMGHDPVHNVMRVKFKNLTVYDYQNVSAEVFEDVMRAESVGKDFNSRIKAHPVHYPYSKVV